VDSKATAVLERVADYLFEHAPDRRAVRLVSSLHDAPATLLTSPNCGRPGKREGTPELVRAHLAYIVARRCTGTRSTSFAACMGRSSGR
jgi:plasmid stabilization system protein ParE